MNNIINFNVQTKVLPTKGNLVYEYNPFRNYRLTQIKYEYQEQLYTEQELEDNFNIFIDKTYEVIPNATIQNGKKVALENGTAINIPITAIPTNNIFTHTEDLASFKFIDIFLPNVLKIACGPV